MRRKLELGLAVFSVVAAVVHFLGEMAYHREFGQFLPSLWVDWIADLLLLSAAVRVWRGAGAVGLLCGGWGFTLCLNLVAFNGFFLETLEGRVGPGVERTVAVLALALVISIAAFALSLALTWRRSATP